VNFDENIDLIIYFEKKFQFKIPIDAILMSVRMR